MAAGLDCAVTELSKTFEGDLHHTGSKPLGDGDRRIRAIRIDDNNFIGPDNTFYSFFDLGFLIISENISGKLLHDHFL
jgi:hypothetical protein